MKLYVKHFCSLALTNLAAANSFCLQLHQALRGDLNHGEFRQAVLFVFPFAAVMLDPHVRPHAGPSHGATRTWLAGQGHGVHGQRFQECRLCRLT